MQNYNAEMLGIRVNYLESSSVNNLASCLSRFMKVNTIVICIGTDKCIGDCLGPLVGTFLTRNSFPYPVIGTLERPAHAINLDYILKDIKMKYKDPFIIAIDACLGYDNCIGDIQVKSGPVHPGKGVGKTLPHVGDISIVGVVDTIDNSDLFSIKNIRLNFIMNMADIISQGLLQAAKKRG